MKIELTEREASLLFLAIQNAEDRCPIEDCDEMWELVNRLENELTARPLDAAPAEQPS